MTDFRPGTRWLTTPRTAPAWRATIDLLDDNQWHPVEIIAQAMRDTADLAPRTIKAHLRSASRRGWIRLSHGRVQLRDRSLIEAALDHVDGVS